MEVEQSIDPQQRVITGREKQWNEANKKVTTKNWRQRIEFGLNILLIEFLNLSHLFTLCGFGMASIAVHWFQNDHAFVTNCIESLFFIKRQMFFHIWRHGPKTHERLKEHGENTAHFRSWITQTKVESEVRPQDRSGHSAITTYKPVSKCKGQKH